MFVNNVQELRQAQAQAQVQKEAAQVQATPASPSAQSASLTDVTILTRVQEKSTLDVTRILNDLEEREAELTIMQAVLSQKEAETRVGSTCYSSSWQVPAVKMASVVGTVLNHPSLTPLPGLAYLPPTGGAPWWSLF